MLVNNAGQTWGAPAETMPFERWHQVIETNITGTFLMSQVVGRHMLERQKGAIVNIASIAGFGGGQLQTIGYNSSKAAVINLTRSLAIEWASRGIRVNGRETRISSIVTCGCLSWREWKDGCANVQSKQTFQLTSGLNS